MALPADYIAGTITLTNGSASFTGTGTGWEAALFRPGDTLLGIEDHAGLVYIIETITGNTTGTLTQPWEGATGTYEYRMRYQWDSSRVSAQTRAVIELLGNGNLMAMASLTGAPDQVPVFTGPGAMTLVPRSEFGSGDVVGPASAVDSGLVAFDGTTGKLIKAASGVTNTQLANMAQATIKGRAAGGGAGAPTDLSADQVLTILATGGNYQRTNILGTVSQASGIPTGAAIERGINANGEYVRLADGTQICWKQVPQTLVVNAGSIGTFLWTYPSNFINAGTIDTQINVAGTTPAAATSFRWGTGTPSATNVTFYMYNDTASNVQAYPTVSARGRWF